jgi:hypothetical protein
MCTIHFGISQNSYKMLFEKEDEIGKSTSYEV